MIIEPRRPLVMILHLITIVDPHPPTRRHLLRTTPMRGTARHVELEYATLARSGIHARRLTTLTLDGEIVRRAERVGQAE